MDVYGSLRELVSVILRKSGFAITVSSPDVVSKDYDYKLPDTNSNTSATLVTTDHTQTLSNKTLSSPTISNFTNAGHTHASASMGGQLSNTAIASGAAIERSKLASGTANHVIINNGSGVMSSEATLAPLRGGFGLDMTGLTPSVGGTNTYRVDKTIASNQSGIKLYKTIQAAIDAILDASSSNPYKVVVAPGRYTENVTLKDYVFLEGSTTGTVTIVGHITATGLSGSSGIFNLVVEKTPTAGGQFCINHSGGTFTISGCEFYIVGNADYSVTGAALSSGTALTIFNSTVWDRRSGNISASFVGWSFAGAGTYGVFNASCSARGEYTGGNHALFQCTGTGSFTQSSGAAIFGGTGNLGSGTVKGFCCESVSANPRITSNLQIRLSTVSGGTSYGFCLEAAAGAEFFHVGPTLFSDGFTTSQISITDASDTQKIWLNSANKYMAKYGDGVAIITPQDEAKSGFVEFRGNPADGSTTFWSWGSPNFTVSLGGAGVVRGAPVTWAGGQSVSLTDLATNYVYMTSSGTIAATVTANESLFLDNIVLFEVWRDGATILVTKENHPYKFTSAVSGAWHRLFGVLLEGTGANIAQLGAASALQLQVTGTDVLTDHGLDTAIPADAGPLSVIYIEYLNGPSGGAAKYYNTLTTIPDRVWSLPATPDAYAAVQNNSFVVHRLYVTKNSLNSTAPAYISIIPTVEYATLAQANAAIAGGAIQSLPPEIAKLECAQLGYVILKKQGGVLQIDSIVVEKQTFSARFLGSSPATSAGLITTSTTNFGVILSGADVSVQAALETIDDTAAKRASSGTDNALVRFDGATGQLLQNGTITQDDSGNLSSVGTVNNHAIPSGTDAFVTVDATQSLTAKTLVSPTIAATGFGNANHTHTDANSGGLIVEASATQQGAVSTGAQTFAGAKTFASGVLVNTISEQTSGSGVTIDSALIKDGTFQANSTDANKLPVGTSAQRSTAAAGNIRHNSDLTTVEFHDGSTWVPMTKIKTVALASGTVDLYTPETGVVAYEALVYSSAGTSTSLSSIKVVNDNGAWTYSASEAGDDVVDIVVASGTGKLSLTAAASGTCKSRIQIII